MGGLANQQKTVQAIQQAQALAAQIQQVQAAQQRAEQLAQKVLAQQKQVQSIIEDQNDRNQPGGQAVGKSAPDAEQEKDARRRTLLGGLLSKLTRPKQQAKAPPPPQPPASDAKVTQQGSAPVLKDPSAPPGKVASVPDPKLRMPLGGPNAVAAKAAKRLAKPTGPVLTRRAKQGVVLPYIPIVGSFKANEVLAINFDAATFKSGAFQVTDTVELKSLGFSVSRIETPDAINGQKALTEQLPDGEFTFNRLYAPHRMGLGLGSSVKGGKGCSSDRCFGADLIKWQPKLANCARTVKVGIIDTGYDKRHSALKHLEPSARYREFLPAKAKLVPQHGTAILSILAGDTDSSVPGLIPKAEYYIANAFFADPRGQAMSETVYILRALDWMLEQQVDVVNLSFSGPEDELMHVATKRLTSAGIVVIAAAGNDGPSAPPSYPAGYEEVIAVTAVDRNRLPYAYANRGSYIDLAAPGVGIWTALPGEREGAQTGTSFAVPYVTAVVAANYPSGLGETDDPTLTKRLALAPLLKNVKGVSGQGMGAGLVQASHSCGDAPAGPAVAGPWSTSTVHSAAATGAGQ